MPCEDYPCCGHGPAPYGDGGGCPDAQGRFNCVECGRKMPKNSTSAICAKCRTRRYRRSDGDYDIQED
jgi:hypothetical protein